MYIGNRTSNGRNADANEDMGGLCVVFGEGLLTFSLKAGKMVVGFSNIILHKYLQYSNEIHAMAITHH